MLFCCFLCIVSNPKQSAGVGWGRVKFAQGLIATCNFLLSPKPSFFYFLLIFESLTSEFCPHILSDTLQVLLKTKKSTSPMVGLGDKIKLMLSLSIVNEKKMNYVLITSDKITTLKYTGNICYHRFFTYHCFYFPKLKRFLKCRMNFKIFGYMCFKCL